MNVYQFKPKQAPKPKRRPPAFGSSAWLPFALVFLGALGLFLSGLGSDLGIALTAILVVVVGAALSGDLPHRR
ncbi:hypothetical protein [Aureimonas psammosilenae]|uniref:hypothetical protein n=1 Tax=Aureimonas psammosilenae TaxID=2495496 RepID=UPI001260905A|nr:hypothetical protein [Aureimonas psammosilenae]